MKKSKRNQRSVPQTGFILVLLSAALFYLQLTAQMQMKTQMPVKPVTPYVAEYWKTPDWLSGAQIFSIAQTPDGYLWLATPKGLVRFDGIRFKAVNYYETPGEKSKKKVFPDVLCVDRDGVLWIGSPGRLTRYHYQTGQFKSFTEKHGMTGNRIFRIREDISGGLWIGFMVGYVNRFEKNRGDQARFTSFDAANGLTGKKVRDIVEDAGGTLWICTRENGLFSGRNAGFSKYKGIPPGVETGRLFMALCESRDGDLWVGSETGLLRITPATGETRVYSTANGLPGGVVTDILQDGSGNLWIGTTRGLAQLKKDPAGKIYFKTILEKHSVTMLFEDREQNLWAATSIAGPVSLKPATFTDHPLVFSAGLEEGEQLVAMFREPGGDTWLGSSLGKLFRYRNGACTGPLEIPGVKNTAVTTLALDGQGDLWIGTLGKGLFKMDRAGGRFTAFTAEDGLADNQVISIFKDSKDNLWIGTYNGVSRYRDGVFKSLKAAQGIKGNFVNNVYEDTAHHIWIASNKGLYIIANGDIDGDPVEMTEYLPGIPIACILIQEDAAWLSTHGAGLKRFKDGTFTSYTSAEGLASDFIYQMLVDDAGDLWITADSGILRVNKMELNRFAAGETHAIHCVTYGISDGMKSNQFYNFFSRHSVLESVDHEFWFATHLGITVVNPAAVRINKLPPPVVIEAMDIIRPRGLGDITVQLPVQQEQVFFGEAGIWQFHFTAPSFLCPEKMRFKYKLEGPDNLDGKWQSLQPAGPRTVRYRNLHAGSYTFRVKSRSNNGVRSQTEATFRFSVKLRYYQTLLFKGLIAFAILLPMVGGIYWYRRRSLKRAERNKYKHSHLNRLYVDECLKKLEHLMREEKAYRDEHLSLQTLAEELDILPRYLSQIINERLGMNFSDFVNGYRVEEAMTLLADPARGEKKILAIAFDVGFNTKAAFNIAFKKHTGMTPSQFKKENRK
jgi:ligand-binding sensor domain-containing protein/AraC-like DNA-binding protein